MLMAMEVNSVVSDGFGDVNGSVNLYCDGSVVSVEASENPGNFLEDFDSYWEDIANRVTVSRMVSDSVIKGMVSAIEQDAAEKIADKELELVRLKESLNHYHVAAEESEPFETPVMKCASGSVKHQSYSSFSDLLSDYDWIGESVGSLKYVAEEQLNNLRTEIDRIKGSSSFRRIGSGNELVGLSGNLQGKALDIKWMDVDKALDSLKTTLDSMCKHAGNMVYVSKASLCLWQQEKEFQEEVEDMVIMNCIRNLKEEFEERLCDQNARFYDSESLNWFEKIKEIFNLRGELDAISKSLSVPEIGQLTSHGSIDMGEEWDTNKRTDHLQRKTTGNHLSLSISLSEGNEKHDESVFAMPENLDIKLKHMEKDQLIKHFRNEMTEMKRNHEQKVAEMTEDYFTLRREYLKDRGSSLPIKKDKEFDILRKKIPEVILKLDEILVESENLPNFSEGLCSFRDRLDSLLSENCQLKSFLSEKQKEVKRLSLQISDTAAEVKLQHSLAEANLVKRIRNLQDALDDVHIQTSISDDVNKCLLREAVDCLKSVSEKSDLEYKLIQDVYEIIYREAAQNDKPNNKCRLEDSDLEAVIMQQLYEVIFGEAMREAEVKLDELNRRYSDETEHRISVENVALEKERALRLEFSENEKLRQEIHLLSSLVEEKENLVNAAGVALFEEKNQSELISQELNRLRDETRQQQILISESSKEFDDTKGNLKKALDQIKQYKVDVHELKQKLELAMKELRDTNEEKKMLVSLTEQKQCAISLLEAKGREQRKQMESLIFLIQGLSVIVTELECKVIKDIERCNFRLDSLSSQSSGLIQQASIIKTTGLIYKQKLERRCSDLQKAEAEVDLLGDEVETLLSLLEKIYIALDHYSPILQHYPGILEILKLVRRELSGESTKRVSSAI